MNRSFIRKLIEVLLFSSEKPLSIKELKDIINEEKEQTNLSTDIRTIESALEELIAQYRSNEYSFQIIKVAGAYRFATKKEFAPWLAKLNKEKLKRKLSQSALETLAIITYNQPITKSEIEAVRGVNVDYIIGALLEKELIRITGRAETLGRPILYATSDLFLEYLGLDSLADIPPLKALEDVIKAGPPEGVTQSDIDFFEEINLMKQKAAEGFNPEIAQDGEPNVSETETEPESNLTAEPDNLPDG